MKAKDLVLNAIKQRTRTGFSLCSNCHREKPVLITGNPSSHCRDHVFITGISLKELLHRELHVVITGNGFAVKATEEPAADIIIIVL